MRMITEHNADEWMFNYYEGNLNPAEQQQLMEFLDGNAAFKVDFEAWKHSYVQKQTDEYIYVDQLYAGGGAAGWFRWTIASVAVLVVAGVVAYWLSGTTNSDSNELAQNDTAENSVHYTSAHGPVDGKGKHETNTAVASGNGSAFSGANKEELCSKRKGNGNGTDVDSNKANQNKPKGSGASGLTTPPSASNNSIAATSKREDARKDSRKNSSKRASSDENDYSTDDLLASTYGGGPMAIDIPMDRTGLPEIPEKGAGDSNKENRLKELSEADKVRIYGKNPVSDEIINDVHQSADETIEDLKNQGLITPQKTKKEGFFGFKLKDLGNKPLGLYNMKDHDVMVPGETGIGINPANVGTLGKERIELNHRNQWANSENTNNSYQFAYDTYSDKIKGGIGFEVAHDNFEKGMYKSTSVGLMYSPKIKITRELYIEPGVKLSYTQKTLDWNKITPGSSVETRRGAVFQTYDSSYNVRGTMLGFRDVSVGFLVNHERFYAGVSVDHLFEPNENVYSENFEGEYNLPRRYIIQVGTDYKRSAESGLIVSPSLLYHKQGELSELWGNLTFKYKWLLIGGGGTVNGNAKALLGFTGSSTSNVKFTYSFDMTESLFTGEKLPSHELSLRFLIDSKVKRGFRH